MFFGVRIFVQFILGAERHVPGVCSQWFAPLFAPTRPDVCQPLSIAYGYMQNKSWLIGFALTNRLLSYVCLVLHEGMDFVDCVACIWVVVWQHLE